VITAPEGPADTATPDDGGLVLLVETIEHLSLARSVEDVAAVVRSAARRISGADGVCFVLREGAECRYLDEDAIGPLWKGRRFPMSQCISGWAMLNGETAVIADVFADVRIPHDAYAPTFVKSLVMTPVRRADPIAAIGAYWAEVRQPRPSEVVKLAMVARATATALENVRLIGSLEEAVASRDFLIRELDHRVKNSLAAVRSITQQTLRTARSPEAFNDALAGRLDALARAYDLIARERSGQARLRQVLEQAMPIDEGDRVSLTGPELRLSPQTAVNFQMAFHELATNAARHGALASADGSVEVCWRIAGASDAPTLVLSWRESGGPQVTAPEAQGFGLRLAAGALARGLGGQASLAFDPDGLRYELSAPLSTALWAAEA
jgi:two-component sensor histidine kinase